MSGGCFNRAGQSLKRLNIRLVFLAHGEDMCAHRVGRRRALAAQDRHHDAIMLDIGFRQPPKIAELRATKRLYPSPRADRDFGEIRIMRAVIDRAVERLVDLVVALRIAAITSRFFACG